MIDKSGRLVCKGSEKCVTNKSSNDSLNDQTMSEKGIKNESWNGWNMKVELKDELTKNWWKMDE